MQSAVHNYTCAACLQRYRCKLERGQNNISWCKQSLLICLLMATSMSDACDSSSIAHYPSCSSSCPVLPVRCLQSTSLISALGWQNLVSQFLVKMTLFIILLLESQILCWQNLACQLSKMSSYLPLPEPCKLHELQYLLTKHLYLI